MAPAVALALEALPPKLAADVPGWRRRLFEQPGHLAAILRRVEGQAADGRLPAESMAQLWAWAVYLVLVRGHTAHTTAARYVEIAAEFLCWCAAEGVPFATARLEELDGWQKWLFLQRRNGESWRTRKAAAVRNFYDWRATRGLGENCASGLRTSRERPRMPRKYSTDQLRGLLAATADTRTAAGRSRDKAMLLMLLATGARRNELVNLDIHDLEMGTRTGIARIMGKGAREREVSFEGPLVTALQEWLAMRAELPFPVEPKALFVAISGGASRGRRISARTVEALVERCAKAAGLRNWGVHRFRVTFATALYDAGAEIEEIRILMGHERIETTRRYLAVSERARRTRLSAKVQHVVLGNERDGQPRWVANALGGRGK